MMWSSDTHRQCSKTFSKEGKIVSENKSGQAGGGTPVNPGLTTTKEWLMVNRTAALEPKTKVETCRVFLSLVQADLDNSTRLRRHYIGLAQQYGLTNSDIGEALGISEAAVRSLVKHGDA